MSTTGNEAQIKLIPKECMAAIFDPHLNQMRHSSLGGSHVHFSVRFQSYLMSSCNGIITPAYNIGTDATNLQVLPPSLLQYFIGLAGSSFIPVVAYW